MNITNAKRMHFAVMHSSLKAQTFPCVTKLSLAHKNNVE